MTERETLNTFWHGSELSPLHWACLKSFVDRGHRLRVFTYHPLTVPEGVRLDDARRILPEDQVFEFAGSFSGFSNLFRYKLLFEEGGWWVDCDVYCLTDTLPACRYAWAHQELGQVNGAILRFPAGDPDLKSILDGALAIGRGVSVWGELGPRLLTNHLNGHAPEGHFGSTQGFYPVHFLEAHLFWLPGCAESIWERCRGASFLHLWAAMFPHYGIDIRRWPPRGGFLREIYERAGFPRSIPTADADEEQRTLASIEAFLRLDWVRDRSNLVFGRDLTLPAVSARIDQQ